MDQAVSRLVDRGDLLAALDRAAAKKVTTISAPAGGGKTSLLHAWANRPGQPHRVAFVQVQRDQHDAQQFWLALLGAVREALGTTSGADAPAATPEFNGPAMTDRVLSELAGQPDRVILVIDDLHELNSPDALAQLTRLLTNLPDDVHAVLATRRDLRLRLHRLRLAGELAEIRAADLRFSERETRELLNTAGISWSEAGAALLYQRTEGWVAGLRLAAISLAGHPDPERFVAEFSGSDRTVSEYLIAEMLERQPDDVQDLLLRTSLLDRVNGELADLLAGRPGSERTLLDLADANAFVISLDPERTWFRYHRLFGDLLRLELRRTLPAELPTLHRRAAEWFTRQGPSSDPAPPPASSDGRSLLVAVPEWSTSRPGFCPRGPSDVPHGPAHRGRDHVRRTLRRRAVRGVQSRDVSRIARVRSSRCQTRAAPQQDPRHAVSVINWLQPWRSVRHPVPGASGTCHSCSMSFASARSMDTFFHCAAVCTSIGTHSEACTARFPMPCTPAEPHDGSDLQSSPCNASAGRCPWSRSRVSSKHRNAPSPHLPPSDTTVRNELTTDRLQLRAACDRHGASQSYPAVLRRGVPHRPHPCDSRSGMLYS